MIKALALVAILCGLLLIVDGPAEPAKRDRISIKAINEKRLLTVVVVLHDVTDQYRWLSVYGCSADIGEYGVACNYHFERETSYELQRATTQHLVFWRDVPGGTMQLTAVAFDVNRQPLARKTTVIFRGE